MRRAYGVELARSGFPSVGPEVRLAALLHEEFNFLKMGDFFSSTLSTGLKVSMSSKKKKILVFFYCTGNLRKGGEPQHFLRLRGFT